MIGLPEFGDTVMVWPAPGRAVQHGPRPADTMGGGRMLAEGRLVKWSAFELEQYRAGDLVLHDPTPPPPPEKKPTEGEGSAPTTEEPKLEPRELAAGETLEAAAPPAGVTAEPIPAPAPVAELAERDAAPAPASAK